MLILLNNTSIFPCVRVIFLYRNLLGSSQYFVMKINDVSLEKYPIWLAKWSMGNCVRSEDNTKWITYDEGGVPQLENKI